MRKSASGGFTLIELMIVIAIIAVIAAIAIPGLIQSQRASNERNASASLKTLTSAQVDFRANDRDGNKVQDYWTRDVSGLYGLCPIGSDQPVKLIEVSVLGADSNPLGTAAAPVSADEVAASFFQVSAPKAGYWYLGMSLDEDGLPYAGVTNGIAPFTMQPWFNNSRFGFLAYPDSFTLGRSMFYVNEYNTIFKRTLNGSVRPVGGTPPGDALVAAGAVGASPLLQWPSSAQLRLDYAKLD